MSKKNCIIVWHRNDLRLNDNEILSDALDRASTVIPVYIFDDRDLQAADGQAKVSPARIQFTIQSVQAYRQALQAAGGNLLVISGQPEQLIPQLVTKYGAEEVVHHREVGAVDIEISSRVEDALWKQKVNLKHIVSHTLYNKEDLPFPVKDIPENFTRFKKKVEREAEVKPPLPAPVNIPVPAGVEWGEIPPAESTVKATPPADTQVRFQGGAVQGHAMLSAFITVALANPKPKAPVTSYVSPWLANGCISPREAYWAVKNAVGTKTANAVLNNFLLGLLWRDYYRFMLKKHGALSLHESDAAGRQAAYDLAMAHSETAEIMQQLQHSGFLTQAQRAQLAAVLLECLNNNIAPVLALFEYYLLDYNVATCLCILQVMGGGWHNVELRLPGTRKTVKA